MSSEDNHIIYWFDTLIGMIGCAIAMVVVSVYSAATVGKPCSIIFERFIESSDVKQRLKEETRRERLISKIAQEKRGI